MSLLVSCGSNSSSDDPKTPSEDNTPITGGEGILADTSKSGLKSFLTDGKYKDWTKDAAVHQDGNSGPHGKVRIYFNDLMVEAFEQNKTEYPVGSASVKELYANDGTTLQGYAVGIKVTTGTKADSWLWYEGFNPSLDQYYGKAISPCSSCHAKAVDAVFARPRL